MNEEQSNLVASLRELADFLETKDFDLSNASLSYPEVYIFCHSGDAFLKNVSVLGGFKREFNDYAAQAVKRFGQIRFIIHSSREQVCERVKVGVEVVPATPEQTIPAKPERIIDKYEYKCPESLLSGKEAM